MGNNSKIVSAIDDDEAMDESGDESGRGGHKDVSPRCPIESNGRPEPVPTALSAEQMRLGELPSLFR